MVRYWVSAGRGGFGLSPVECLNSTFYVMVTEPNPDQPDPVKGWKVKTSPIEAKSPYFASVKSTNYLPNALCVLEAELSGFDQV